MNDPASLEIINDAAKALGKMLSIMVRIGKFSACPIYLFGGTFKNKNSRQFIQKILQAAGLEEWETFNRSGENPTVLAVQCIKADR